MWPLSVDYNKLGFPSYYYMKWLSISYMGQLWLRKTEPPIAPDGCVICVCVCVCASERVSEWVSEH